MYNTNTDEKTKKKIDDARLRLCQIASAEKLIVDHIKAQRYDTRNLDTSSVLDTFVLFAKLTDEAVAALINALPEEEFEKRGKTDDQNTI